jgi:hypothetical protein
MIQQSSGERNTDWEANPGGVSPTRIGTESKEAAAQRQQAAQIVLRLPPR